MPTGDPEHFGQSPPLGPEAPATATTASFWPLTRDLAKRHRIFVEATHALLVSTDRDMILTRIIQCLVPDFADWCLVNVVQQDGTMLRLADARALPPSNCRALDEIRRRFPPCPHATFGLAEVIRSGEAELYHGFPDAFFLANASDPDYLRLWRQVGIVSYMGLPLTVRGRVVGGIAFDSVTPGRIYQQQDLELAKELAGLISLALERCRLFQDLVDTNRVKDEFLATLSHELRTPLTAVLGWSQLLLSTHRSPERDPMFEPTKALAVIERNAHQLLNLIDSILEASSASLGKIRLVLATVDLYPLLRLILETIHPSVQAKGLEVVLHTQLKSAVVLGDEARLQQVLFNVATNSVKFTPKGGRIDIFLTELGSSYCMQVRDTGIGIPPHFLPFVFERFRQADSSPSKPFPGLGIGLGLVRDIMELHGGSVTCTSPGAGLGTTVTLLLEKKGPAGSEETFPTEFAAVDHPGLGSEHQ